MSKAALSSPGPKTIVMVLYTAGAEVAQAHPNLLGCVEHALGIREWLEEAGHTVIVTADKEGETSELERVLDRADVIISTPFHPAYLTRDRIQRAKNLKLALTAGIGSDHIDLGAARDAGITVAEVTGSNVVSVAEHAVMQILILIRNFVPAYTQVINGEWDVAKCVAQSYDLEGKVVGTVGAGRIGQRILKRLGPFDCGQLLYYDYARLDAEKEAELGVKYADLEDLVARCDVVTINCPLHEDTRGLFDAALISKMKRGSYIVNTARGAICDADAVVQALESGQLGGYAGDVFNQQPAPADHPWRSMPNHAMTPHMSGSSLDAQARYSAGVKEILRRSFAGEALNPADVIVQGGKLAPQYDKTAAAEHRTLAFQQGWEKPPGGVGQ